MRILPAQVCLFKVLLLLLLVHVRNLDTVLNPGDDLGDDVVRAEAVEKVALDVLLRALALFRRHLNKGGEQEGVLGVDLHLDLGRRALPELGVGLVPRKLFDLARLVRINVLHLHALGVEVAPKVFDANLGVDAVTHGEDARRLLTEVPEEVFDKAAEDAPPRHVDDEVGARGGVDGLEHFDGPVNLTRDAEVEPVEAVDDVECERAREHNLHNLERRGGALVCAEDILEVFGVGLHRLRHPNLLRLAHGVRHVAQRVDLPARAVDVFLHVLHAADEPLVRGLHVEDAEELAGGAVVRRRLLRHGHRRQRLGQVGLNLGEENDVAGSLGEEVADRVDGVWIALVVLNQLPDVLERVGEDKGALEQRPHIHVARHEREVGHAQRLEALKGGGRYDEAILAHQKHLPGREVVRGVRVANHLLQLVLVRLLVHVLVRREHLVLALLVDARRQNDVVLLAVLGVVEVREVEHDALVRREEVVDNL
mmetsp:Transcript_24580/g.80307  ORF Transcript_24580/g.80307 Transcript_24580/m.80307 type:complete len:481 (+) Transcript_24580:391-1833(+)